MEEENAFLLEIFSKEERRGQIIHFRLLKFTPRCVQWHFLMFNPLPPVTIS